MLSERFGIPLNQILNTFSSSDISELMAYDLLKDKDYRDRLEMEMKTPEQNAEALRKLLGG